jgi:tetratricopeptide (TPR) repeat protein
MKNNHLALEKKAIEAALNARWQEAVEINQQILEEDAGNIDAKLRLGKAYLQTSEFNKAKKIYKEVLEIDPVNQTAQRNYKFASDKKTDKSPQAQVATGSLIIEPGTTQNVTIEISAKRVMADDFSTGEQLEIKVEKNSISFYKGNLLVGSLANEIVSKLQSVKSQGGHMHATVADGHDKSLGLLIKTNIPVFKSEKQEVRPYIKKGSIDEPELEIPEIEEVL